jgi:hypothetical protein
MEKKPTSQSVQQHVLRTSVFSSLISGCAIVVILGIAVGLGLWLDAAFPTGRRVFTFAAILVSVPITLFFIFFLSKWLTAKMPPPGAEGSSEQE